MKPVGHVLYGIWFYVVLVFRCFHFLQFLVRGFSCSRDFPCSEKGEPDANGVICIFVAVMCLSGTCWGKRIAEQHLYADWFIDCIMFDVPERILIRFQDKCLYHYQGQCIPYCLSIMSVMVLSLHGPLVFRSLSIWIWLCLFGNCKRM